VTTIPAAVREARERAEEMVSAGDVQRAIDRISVRLAVRLQDTDPLVLAVMHGGLPFAGELLRRFAFPLEYGYIHVGRYDGNTRGTELVWRSAPDYRIAGRQVLIVDDVLDRGATLAALKRWAEAAGAAEVVTGVLVDKVVDEPRPIAVDFAALRCPDRYLFGCGMDFRGYWRNLPAIYALPGDLEDP
jgi:hypoxanthine phosphoribosyltransferase